MKRDIKIIEINSINYKDDTFLYSFPVKIERITESIKKVGLLNPIILFGCGDKYKIISGFKRFFAYKHLGYNDIDAFVFKSGSISDLEAFLISIYDNIEIRELNIIEKGNILSKLKKRFNLNDNEIIGEYMPVLQLEPSKKLLYDFINLCKLDDDLKEHLINRDVPIKVSSLLTSLSDENLKSMSEIITKLNLGANKIKELVAMIDEISKRDDIGIKKLLYDLKVIETLKNEKMTISQKWERIICILKEKRFPTWNDIEKKIIRNISSLNLPPNIHFKFPSYLEGNKYTFELEFSNSNELKNIGMKLIDISERKEFLELIELI